MPEFRPIAEDETVAHQAVMDHAFGDDAGPPGDDGPGDVSDYLAERWGLFDGEELVSACLLYDLDATLAGGTTPIGGIGGFATPPEHRSQGYGHRLQRAALETFRERGYPYAVLWPMSIPYYRETGWGLAHLETEYSFPPSAITGFEAPADGRFERVHPGEYERIEPVYDRFRERYALALERSPAWWRERVLEDAWTYSWTPAESTTATGYAVCRLPGTEGEQTLVVNELVADAPPARRALLALLGRHLPQVESVSLHCPEETRLCHEATDPGAVTATATPGAMGRIVDVAGAIEALPPSRNPPTAVGIEVSDGLFAGNDGTVIVDAGVDGPTCEDEAGAGPPAVALDVATLSKLYAGTVGVETLAERDEIAVDPGDAAVAALAALFPVRPVYLADFF